MTGPSKPRSTPVAKVDRMCDRCGLNRAFPGARFGSVRPENMDARGTGRTTMMLLYALVAYEEGEGVVIIGANNDLQMQSRFEELAGKARVGEHGLGRPRFIDAARHMSRAREIPKGWKVFIDHWAAHQLVENALGGAVVMESPY